MAGWVMQGLLIIVHGNVYGRLQCRPSIDHVLGRPYHRLRETCWLQLTVSISVTSRGLLRWLPGLIWSLGCGRSLWTNQRWSNFPLSHQLPLRSRGRPGYWHNLELIHSGLWSTCRNAIGWLFVSSRLSQGSDTRQFLSGGCRFVRCCVDCVFDSIATCHLLSGACRFVVPTSGPYIYSAFPALPLTSSLNSPSAILSKSFV